MALTALGCHIRHHDVLTVSAAAVFRHLHIAGFMEEACQTRPREEREEGENSDTHCPEAMSLVTLHIANTSMPTPVQGFRQSLYISCSVEEGRIPLSNLLNCETVLSRP